LKALVKHSKTQSGVSLMEIDTPRPKQDELLVKIMAAGICGTDLHIIQDEYPCKMPVVLGHEFTGIIEEIGKEVEGYKIGDQIIASTAAKTCGSCSYCKQGLRMLCKDRLSIGSGLNGAMAEYMVIPAQLAYKIPEREKGKIEIALAEPMACVVRAVIEESHIRAGDIVIVSGPGTIGILTMLFAKHAGAYVIVNGLESDSERLDLATAMGADLTCSNEGNLRKAVSLYAPDGVDVAFECSGYSNSYALCLEYVKKRGNLAQVGLFGKPICIDMDKHLCKEVKLTVSYASEPTSWDTLIKILSQHDLSYEPLISDVYKLEEWEQAFDKFKKKQGFKILLKP